MSKNIQDVAKLVRDASNDRVKDYNIVFRQLSANLIIASGILLALSTQITGELKNADTLSKALAAGIVVSLTLSISFGIVQQLLEAEFFRKGATKRRDILEDIYTGKITSVDKADGKIEAITEEIGRAVSRWASVVQLVLLALALLLIIATVVVYLFV